MDNNLRPMIAFLASFLIALSGIATLVWIGTQDEPKLPVTVECKITTPQIMLDSGWKVMGKEDEPHINALARKGKVQVQAIDGLVSCTRYEDHKTPITSKYRLVIWRKA